MKSDDTLLAVAREASSFLDKMSLYFIRNDSVHLNVDK